MLTRALTAPSDPFRFCCLALCAAAAPLLTLALLSIGAGDAMPPGAGAAAFSASEGLSPSKPAGPRPAACATTAQAPASADRPSPPTRTR